MEFHSAGGLEKSMRPKPTGEVLHQMFRNVLVEFKEAASILSTTVTVMLTGMNGNFVFHFVCSHTVKG